MDIDTSALIAVIVFNVVHDAFVSFMLACSYGNRPQARITVVDMLKEKGLFRGTTDNPMRLGLCSRSKVGVHGGWVCVKMGWR